MALKKVFALVGSVALTGITASTMSIAQSPVIGLGLGQIALTAHPVKDSPFSVKLQGGPFTEQNMAACEYARSSRGRMSYWFNITWGDGTHSNLQRGPNGESCSNLGTHHYTRAGSYDIHVYVSTLGNVDQPLPLYNLKTTVVIH